MVALKMNYLQKLHPLIHCVTTVYEARDEIL